MPENNWMQQMALKAKDKMGIQTLKDFGVIDRYQKGHQLYLLEASLEYMKTPSDVLKRNRELPSESYGLLLMTSKASARFSAKGGSLDYGSALAPESLQAFFERVKRLQKEGLRLALNLDSGTLLEFEFQLLSRITS